MAKREIPGMWWLATRPEEKWVGTLLLEPDETPSLSVMVPKGFYDVMEWPIPAVIHGHDKHGHPITLYFASPPRSDASAALTQLKFSAGTAVVGIEFADIPSFEVHSLMFRMQHLFDWSGITGFIKDETPSFHDIKIRYTRPKDKRFQIDADLAVELRASYSQTNNYEGKTLEEDLIIAFESKNGLRYPKCDELCHAVRHLLHFAVLKQIYPLNVTANRAGYGHVLEEKLYPHEIEIYTSLVRERVRSETQHERWVFRFSDVEADFGAFMRKWLEYLNRFDEALKSYFSTIYHRFPDTIEHLCLTQAFDAYHGIKFSSHNDSGYEAKVLELVEPHRASLAGLVDDPADFATTVLHNRNYYTHHNPKWKAKGRILEGTELIRLNEKLRLVFQMNVLADNGIPSDRFRRLRRQLATHIINYK